MDRKSEKGEWLGRGAVGRIAGSKREKRKGKSGRAKSKKRKAKKRKSKAKHPVSNPVNMAWRLAAGDD